MRKHIIAIGGGGFGRKNSSLLIEEYLLSISGKDYPKICFLPTATGDNDSYIVRFYSIFTRLKCIPSHIEFFKRTIDIENHIMDQDIIFVGGGNTKSMLAIWNDWGMSQLLKDAYNKGVIMSGVSAGAICWFTSGITDSWDNELRILPCLNFISGTCCPHYDEEPARIPFVKSALENNLIDNCLSIEGNCALHLRDNNPYRAINFGKNKNVFKTSLENGKVFEDPFKRIDL